MVPPGGPGQALLFNKGGTEEECFYKKIDEDCFASSIFSIFFEMLIVVIIKLISSS